MHLLINDSTDNNERPATPAADVRAAAAHVRGALRGDGSEGGAARAPQGTVGGRRRCPQRRYGSRTE